MMSSTLPLGYDDALKLTLANVKPLPSIHVDLMDGLHHALADDVVARVDSPSIDASLKDGYAVVSSDVATAAPGSPVWLNRIGTVAAGDSRRVVVTPGAAVRVLTGAKIPPGADAVVSEEYTSMDAGRLAVRINAESGRNILPRGSDVAAGQVIATRGSLLSPGLVGLLAAAGHNRLQVVRPPVVAIVSTGDEVVAPGQPLSEGKLYASNMTTLGCWCRRYGMQIHLSVVRDDPTAIQSALQSESDNADAIITSGGAWTGDRDLVANMLGRLGWKQIFHRIRIGPGKAVGFGLLAEKPVFILPGGPPSNLMGFLQIALPGLLALGGHRRTRLPSIKVRLEAGLKGRGLDWTQFVYGTLSYSDAIPRFHSLKSKSRLRSMAEAHAVVAIPEGERMLPEGAVVTAQLLT